MKRKEAERYADEIIETISNESGFTPEADVIRNARERLTITIMAHEEVQHRYIEALTKIFTALKAEKERSQTASQTICDPFRQPDGILI